MEHLSLGNKLAVRSSSLNEIGFKLEESYNFSL